MGHPRSINHFWNFMFRDQRQTLGVVDVNPRSGVAFGVIESSQIDCDEELAIMKTKIAVMIFHGSVH
jgi:hypothetical protein